MLFFAYQNQNPSLQDFEKMSKEDITRWVEIVKSIEDATRFIKAFYCSKAEEFVKHVNDPFKDEPLATISVFRNASFDVHKILLQTIRNGANVQVTSADPTMFQNVDNYLLPSYTIEDSGVPIPGNLCKVCDFSFTNSVEGIYCVCCGYRLCILCRNLKPVLHLGFNSKNPLCNTCVHKCTETNAILWIKQASFAMKSGDHSAARLFLDIGNKYASSLISYPTGMNSVSKAMTEVEALAVQLQDYKTKILCLNYQGVKGFQWGTYATKMCQKGDHMYPFALFCLKLINSKDNLESNQQWETLGDRLGSFHEELAFFCYNQCPFSPEKWIEKSKVFDELASKEDKKVHFQLVYHCIKHGIRRLNSCQRLLLVNQFLQENRHRLALYLLRACNLPTDEIISLLRHWYNKVTGDYRAVIAIMKYIIVRTNPEIIKAFPKSDMLLHTLSQLHQFPSVTLDNLIEDVNAIDLDQLQEILFPLAFIKYKSLMSWDDLEDKASEIGSAHAAAVFCKLNEIDMTLSGRRKKEDHSKWDVEKDSYIEELD